MKTILNRWMSGWSVVLLLGLSMGVSSCGKEMDDSDKLDVTIPFYYDNDYNLEWSIESLSNYAAHECVRNIFIAIVPGEKFTNLATGNISILRRKMDAVMAISPKISGRGNFVFSPGNCAYGESLRFVEIGFTVNQQERWWH